MRADAWYSMCVCMRRQGELWAMSSMSDHDPAQMLAVLQDNSPPDCLPSSSALSVRSLTKVAYLGKVGGVVPSSCFSLSDGRRGIVACPRLKPAFPSGVSKWKFCSFQGNIIG